MGRIKLNRVITGFTCDMDLIQQLDAMPVNKSEFVNISVREGIREGHGLEEVADAKERGVRIHVYMDRDLDQWLKTQVAPMNKRSAYINQCLRRKLCK